MAETHFTEIEWTQGTHKSYDRVIQSWDGTRIMGDMVETMLPKFRYTQTNGIDGIKYYTDQDNPPYATSVYIYGGQPGDEADLTMCGCFVRSSYYCYLTIGGYGINDSDHLYHSGSIILSPDGTYDHAFKVYKDDHGTVTFDVKGTENGAAYPGVGYITANWFWEDDPQYFPNDSVSFGVNDVEKEFIRYIETDFPIFENVTDLEQYVRTGDARLALNYNDKWQLDETKYYYIYNNQTTGKLFNGSITPVSGATYTWHSMKFSANSEPVLYYDDAFGLTLQAKSVVASKAVTGPGYVLDNIPEEGWTEGALEYTGMFYGTVPDRIECCGSLPDNGNYTYGYELNTNIYRFHDKASADYAQETGDYSGASNYYDLQTGNTHAPVTMGDAEGDTNFGSGSVTSPFVSSYICSRNDVLSVAGAFYSNDTSIIDNIKKGLELFGSEPFQCLCGLSWFPFNLTTICTAAAQPYIYFGSYKHAPSGFSIDKIINLKSNGYVNAGSVYIAPLFQSYRDFEPFCQLSVYLPYHGWEKLDIAKYYKKTVNIRYYVDIYTNTYACALVADNQIIDVFPGNIGNTLPISGTNMSQYANSMLQSVLGTVGGTAGGALTGAMIGGGVPGAVIGAAVGGFAGLAKGTFDMSQKGQPKDHLMIKGAFSGASASYMPQYVIFRYDIHNLIVPDNLTALYGRPSSSGGKISTFNGFLKCDTVKLNTGGMTDPEITEVLTLLREGIFI